MPSSSRSTWFVTRERRAKLATDALFAIHGLAMGSWAARIADVQRSLRLDERSLGLALLGLAGGSVLVLPLSGGLSARRGPRPVGTAGWLAMATGLFAIGHTTSAWQLFAALAVFGAGLSALDVAMNAHGAVVERQLERSVMIGFHARWSIGGITAAALATGAIAAHWSPALHLTVIAVLGTVGVGFVGREALDHEPPEGTPPLLAWPSRTLLGLAVVGVLAGFGEGAATDWSAVFLRSVLHAAAAAAALGYMLFAAGMAIARLVGDRAVDRSSAASVIRTRALLAGGGFAIVAAAPVATVALVGYAAVGLGVAVLIPLVFSVAERAPGIVPGQGIAGVATISYAAFFAGPPVIGLIAHATSLRWSMALIALLLVCASLVPIPD
jgi:MFS family permease